MTDTAHSLSFPAGDGSTIDLSDHAGKPVLIVDTASECGFTPQYAGLEHLWQTYRARGLVVIAIPSNDFGAQEPGSNAEIADFCATRFGVSFPIAAKAPVLDGAAHPFFAWVERMVGEAGAPKWNFHKYLIDGDGGLAEIWPSRIAPDSAEITRAVEALL